MLSSRHLEDHIERDRVMIEFDQSSVIHLDWQVVSALEEWTTSGSQKLCIVGPDQLVETPLTTMAAAQWVASANQANISTISYLCKLPRPRTKRPVSMTAEKSGLMSLTYALIRPLIELLPSLANYTE